MGHLKFVCIKQEQLTIDDYQKICDLHQSVFRVSSEDIINILQKNHHIHLYYDKRTNKLIGTVAFQWQEINDNIFMYVGSVVIDPQYQKKCLLTSSILKSVAYTFIHYPFRKKYGIACSTFI